MERGCDRRVPSRSSARGRTWGMFVVRRRTGAPGCVPVYPYVSYSTVRRNYCTQYGIPYAYRVQYCTVYCTVGADCKLLQCIRTTLVIVLYCATAGTGPLLDSVRLCLGLSVLFGAGCGAGRHRAHRAGTWPAAVQPSELPALYPISLLR